VAESRFLKALRERPLLLDAAMGTRLIARGLLHLWRESSATWNLTHPDVVAAIHRADVAAGADAVVANTFQANPRVLREIRQYRRFEEINRRAVELAREAAGPDRFVLGSIAPHQSGRGTIEQAALLADLGVDALLVETWQPERLSQVASRLRTQLDCPMLGSIYDGTEDRALITALVEHLDAFGVNCCPPAVTTQLLQGMAPHAGPDYPLVAKPSGSGPGEPYDPPEVFGRLVPTWLAMGVRLLGGCCGTTEAHIAAMRAALDVELTRN
jgi:methionine synthase I (cobalamin-dependent)